MEEKYCPRCGETYPATLEYFYKAKRYKSGLSSWCKPCTSQVNSKNADLKRGIPSYFIKAEPELSFQGIPKIQMELGHKYKFVIPAHGNDKQTNRFEGQVIQINDRHITLKHNLGFAETFLKWDLAQYKVREV